MLELIETGFCWFAALRVAGGAGVAGEGTRGLTRDSVNKMPVQVRGFLLTFDAVF